MKWFRKCAMTASLMCAGSAAQAQYYPYAAPATLPAPTQSRQMAYQNWSNYNQPTAENVPSPTPTPAGDHSASPSDGAYDAALNGHGGGDCCTNDCSDDCGFICGGGYGLLNPCCTQWYGGLSALHMRRTRPNPYQVSFDTTNPIGELLLNTSTVQDDWQSGFELTVGRYIGCNKAVELTYWTLDNFTGEAQAFDPAGVGSLNTPFDFRSLTFDVAGVPTPVNDWYDGAQAHRLTRRDEVHSLEVNFVNYPMIGNGCSHVAVNWFAGTRFFRFTEGWSFDSADTDPNWGADPANEAFYNIDTENNLFGFQIGTRINYCIGGPRLSVYATPRFGVFWNQMEQHSIIYNGVGDVALDVQSERDTVSLLAQLDVGVNYQITPRWSAYVGYRVVGISGIALADDQVPMLQDDVFGIADIDHNANLVLHGAMAGVRFNF